MIMYEPTLSAPRSIGLLINLNQSLEKSIDI
jgi:hypothetical protein